MTEPTYKALITVEITGPSEKEFGLAMSNAFDILSFGSSGGEGFTPNGTRYNCKVETNLPTKGPMDLNYLLRMLDEHSDPEQRETLRQMYGTDNLEPKGSDS